jgi:antitoxin (DNA-binding transcriptional repressor) of toxin-antitoxin stability system
MAVHEVRLTDSELATLLEEFQKGEEVILARGGQAMAKVVACGATGDRVADWLPGECADVPGTSEEERGILEN